MAHQAVKDLGNDLEVYAHSDDGLIEAFGYKNEPAGKVMGVQWHPEELVAQRETARKIFAAFVHAAGNKI